MQGLEPTNSLCLIVVTQRASMVRRRSQWTAVLLRGTSHQVCRWKKRTAAGRTEVAVVSRAESPPAWQAKSLAEGPPETPAQASFCIAASSWWGLRTNLGSRVWEEAIWGRIWWHGSGFGRVLLQIWAGGLDFSRRWGDLARGGSEVGGGGRDARDRKGRNEAAA
jgi:hypothetical protein